MVSEMNLPMRGLFISDIYDVSPLAGNLVQGVVSIRDRKQSNDKKKNEYLQLVNKCTTLVATKILQITNEYIEKDCRRIPNKLLQQVMNETKDENGLKIVQLNQQPYNCASTRII
jgi:hypothetical protein